MNIHLHANATTTPKTRQYIQASHQSVTQLADELGVSEDTIRRWKRRDGVADGSHTPHRLQTTLTPTQKAVVVELRKTLLLPLDDRLVVTREFIHPDLSRSALDRCLRRHGVANLKTLLPQEDGVQTPPHKTFKDYAPGFVHVDVKYLPQMPDQDQRTDLFAAIDRATRWVYVEILKDKSATTASGFLKRLIDTAPFKITTLLTDNGKEFTDRFCASGERQPTAAHAFDQVCADNRIQHRLTKPRTPRTNGMVERFNGRIADVLRSNRFESAASLQATLIRFVHLYNHNIPQQNLHHKTPLQTLKHWYAQQPRLFNKIPRNHPGPDNVKPEVPLQAPLVLN
ncbi:IS481 family transposase [Candidatus Thiosymbion oneisti]|uniref:IS481 family transposase n=2 Tax=Candidatus Thiosymbion oneisti TaxID=589554 RepID=UPI00105C24AF|nr:IS481 family transposase [Candidatus Thiosymbion oneisti]